MALTLWFPVGSRHQSPVGDVDYQLLRALIENPPADAVILANFALPAGAAHIDAMVLLPGRGIAVFQVRDLAVEADAGGLWWTIDPAGGRRSPYPEARPPHLQAAEATAAVAQILRAEGVVEPGTVFQPYFVPLGNGEPLGEMASAMEGMPATRFVAGGQRGMIWQLLLPGVRGTPDHQSGRPAAGGPGGGGPTAEEVDQVVMWARTPAPVGPGLCDVTRIQLPPPRVAVVAVDTGAGRAAVEDSPAGESLAKTPPHPVLVGLAKKAEAAERQRVRDEADRRAVLEQYSALDAGTPLRLPTAGHPHFRWRADIDRRISHLAGLLENDEFTAIATATRDAWTRVSAAGVTTDAAITERDELEAGRDLILALCRARGAEAPRRHGPRRKPKTDARQRLHVTLRGVYVDHHQALVKIGWALDADGLEATVGALKSNPNRFGRLLNGGDLDLKELRPRVEAFAARRARA